MIKLQPVEDRGQLAFEPLTNLTEYRDPRSPQFQRSALPFRSTFYWKKVQKLQKKQLIESNGLAVEPLAHDQKVVGSIP